MPVEQNDSRIKKTGNYQNQHVALCFYRRFHFGSRTDGQFPALQLIHTNMEVGVVQLPERAAVSSRLPIPIGRVIEVTFAWVPPKEARNFLRRHLSVGFWQLGRDNEGDIKTFRGGFSDWRTLAITQLRGGVEKFGRDPRCAFEAEIFVWRRHSKFSFPWNL